MEDVEYTPADTTEEQLDAILLLLLSSKLNSSFADHANSGFNITTLCENLELKIEKGEEQFLSATLYGDGYVDPLHENLSHIFRISNKGVRFITAGGYVQQLKDKEHKKELEIWEVNLKKSTISANRWVKIGIVFSFILSIASLLISIIALNKK